MAVDTANKRFSMMSLARPETTMLPVPSGAFDTAAERQLLNEEYAFTVINDFVLTADTVSFTVTGEDSTLVHGATFLLAADAGTFTLTGQDVALVVPRLTAAVATFTITSFPVTLTRTLAISNIVGSWIESEVGDYVRGLNDNFDGTTIEQWKNEAEAAALAGPPYPWYTPELKRFFLQYFVSIQ